MFDVGPLGIVVLLAAYAVPIAVGALIAYWVVRLAVRHELRASTRPDPPLPPTP